ERSRSRLPASTLRPGGQQRSVDDEDEPGTFARGPVYGLVPDGPDPPPVWPMVLATSAARSSFFFSMPSPTWYRVNRRMEMFSPILAMASVTTSWTFFLSSFTNGWSTRHTVSKYC